MAEAPTGPPSKVSRRFHPGWRTLLPSCLRQAGRGWGGVDIMAVSQGKGRTQIKYTRLPETQINTSTIPRRDHMEKHTVRNTNTAPKAMRSMLCSDITLVESLPHLVGKPHGPGIQLPKYN